jgi:hypothetical protein
MRCRLKRWRRVETETIPLAGATFPTPGRYYLPHPRPLPIAMGRGEGPTPPPAPPQTWGGETGGAFANAAYDDAQSE